MAAHHVCVHNHCALLYYTTQHRTVLIINPFIPQTVIIAQNDVVYWRKGDRQDRTDYISAERCNLVITTICVHCNVELHGSFRKFETETETET